MLTFLETVVEDFPFLRSLYEAAFPAYERRSWEQLESMFALPSMHTIVARLESERIGFAIYWQIEGWTFLEHLAVHPQYEGNGHGREMMLWLLQQSHYKLLLEAELPTDEASRRRIRFYQKLGFEIAPFPYQQPPYRRAEATPAMHILSVPIITGISDFEAITHTIRQQVFEAFY